VAGVTYGHPRTGRWVRPELGSGTARGPKPGICPNRCADCQRPGAGLPSLPLGSRPRVSARARARRVPPSGCRCR